MHKINSHKPKKQRLFHYHKFLHLKQASLSVHLDKKNRQQTGLKSASVRKGDTVKVLSGTKKGSSGKITGVDYGKGVVFIEKLVRKKASGEEIPLPVHASNLLVTDLDRSDAKRFKRKRGKAAEGKKPAEKKEAAEKKPEKEEKPVEKKSAKEEAGRKHLKKRKERREKMRRGSR